MDSHPDSASLTENAQEMERLLEEAQSKPGVSEALDLQRQLIEIAAITPVPQAGRSITASDYTPSTSTS